jgi:hypothetical protein
MDALLKPTHLFTRQDVLSKPSPIPARPGVYAWYFREVPPGVPVDGCHRHHGLPLLYVGISPSKPPTNGKLPSKQSLAKRIRYHFAGNAGGSTLRLRQRMPPVLGRAWLTVAGRGPPHCALLTAPWGLMALAS